MNKSFRRRSICRDRVVYGLDALSLVLEAVLRVAAVLAIPLVVGELVDNTVSDSATPAPTMANISTAITAPRTRIVFLISFPPLLW
jgi:hypothetical protein